VTPDLIARAQAGDDAAFDTLVDPHRRELHVHCYRMLGSVQDAEDVLQETLLAAWRGIRGFEQRSSVRTWLYRIATSRCLNALRASSRRPQMTSARPPGEPPEPTRLGEVLWLEPYPDDLLDGLGGAVDPAARFDRRESMSLAFMTALQLLPPRQRAVLVLRDVLAFRTGEVAAMLGTTEDAVSSALKRARAALRPLWEGREPPPPPGSPAERALLDRLTCAYEAGDIDAVVALLTDDVWLTMPPVPLEYQGKDLAATFLRTVIFRDGRRYHLVPTRANGQPAFGGYVRDPHAGVLHATGLLVLTLSGGRIAGMTRFESGVLARFGLPRVLRV
jgi:RNA polymerase sigma-70 factor (TIGR02960 family)